MTVTINASTSTGLVQTADTSGIIKVQSNGVTTNAIAWVNFGYISSAITVRSQYNVSSVTRSGTGDYTVNFNTALSDANYSAITGATSSLTNPYSEGYGCYAISFGTTSIRIIYEAYNNVAVDGAIVCLTVFGN
jgi:hypothetical protein